MIRFSLRSRIKGERLNPADRAQSPPRQKHFARAPGSPTSYLVSYDELPRRLPNGHALSYLTYLPSKYYIPSYTRRKPRNADLRDASNALDLDASSLARRRPADDLIPIDMRIAGKVNLLRRLLADGEQLGDLEVLKDLVGIHEAKVTRAKQKADTLKMQIREASIIAGLGDPDDRHGSVKKVHGRPGRNFGGRTVSALKARTGGIRSASRSHRTTLDRDRVRESQQHQTRVKPDLSRLSRKSSARLKRLGSAGSVLIRRLSKVSIAEDASSGSSAEPTSSSTFGQETMKRLRVNPSEVLSGFEEELSKLGETEKDDVDKLRDAQKQLRERRAIHNRAMEILDIFYGTPPGWQENPISKRMIHDTAEMTEAGLEAERDLAEARGIRERARAAREDHGRTLDALHTIGTELRLFEDALDALLSGEHRDTASRMHLTKRLEDMRKHLDKCVQSARLAVECCAHAPRLQRMRRELVSLCKGFEQEANAVTKRLTFYQNDLAATMQVTRGALSDCSMSETFVEERQNMIKEDIKRFDEAVERCEEYVMLERVGILDMHHPRKNKR